MTNKRAPRAHAPALLAVAMLLLAFNLRPAVAAVGPLIHRIRADTGLSGGGAGLLAAVPVLCFGAMAPLAPALARRVGIIRTLVGALATLVAGLLLRIVPGLGFLFLGTVLAGTAIAVGNVLLPVLTRRNFPQRTGLITSVYTTALIGGAALAAAVAVPIANALGGGWRGGLGIWAAPAAVALGAWLLLLQLRRGAEPVSGGEDIAGPKALLHDRLAWALTLFFALQSAGFYATLAWLPSVFRSHGASEAEAGLLLGVSLVVGIGTALTVPALAARLWDQRALVVVFAAVAAVGWIGVLVVPMGAPFLWAVLLGLGQNALFPLALTMIVLRGGTVTSTAGLSTLVQTVGYLLAALAPLGIGALHDLTGSWTTPLLVLLALLVPQTLTGLVAGRRGHVTPRGGLRPSKPLDAA